VTGRTKSRLDVAKTMGVDETVVADDDQEKTLNRISPLGFDVIFEATGAAKIVERTFRFVKGAGRSFSTGSFRPNTNPPSIPLTSAGRIFTSLEASLP